MMGGMQPEPEASTATLQTPVPAEVEVVRRWPPPALLVRPFRWYWAAQWPVFLGTWMQIVALGYYVYQQTHSTTAVGAVAAADGLPAVILSLFGGVLAGLHRTDHRIGHRRPHHPAPRPRGPAHRARRLRRGLARAAPQPPGAGPDHLRGDAVVLRRLLHALPAGVRARQAARRVAGARPAL